MYFTKTKRLPRLTILCCVFQLREKKGKRCPVCNNSCPIDEKVKTNQPSAEKQKAESERKILFCMFCEGDKTYPENMGVPVCGMDLSKKSQK